MSIRKVIGYALLAPAACAILVYLALLVFLAVAEGGKYAASVLIVASAFAGFALIGRADD